MRITELDIFDQIKKDFELTKEYHLEHMSLEDYNKCLDITNWIHINHTNINYINLSEYDIKAEYHISEDRIMDIQYKKTKKTEYSEEII